MDDKDKQFATRAIHAGQAPDPTTGAIMPPIYATSTYVQESPGVHKGYEYSRTQNPTREALDPVRYISNNSSGKMGYAIARAAVEAGALTTLVSGPGFPCLGL